jgi:protein involved in temperature-dependent protein secretion
MGPANAAEQALRDGDPAAALAQLQAEVRAKPADAKLRVFLFQLLSVLGQWERALNQLNTAATLDVDALAMAQTYREAIHCESLRARVFAGKKSPMVFGEPQQWLALLIEAMLQEGQGRPGDGQRAARPGFRRGRSEHRRDRWSSLHVDRRCGLPPGPRVGSDYQRPLLLGAIFAPDESVC